MANDIKCRCAGWSKDMHYLGPVLGHHPACPIASRLLETKAKLEQEQHDDFMRDHARNNRTEMLQCMVNGARLVIQSMTSDPIPLPADVYDGVIIGMERVNHRKDCHAQYCDWKVTLAEGWQRFNERGGALHVAVPNDDTVTFFAETKRFY